MIPVSVNFFKIGFGDDGENGNFVEYCILPEPFDFDFKFVILSEVAGYVFAVETKFGESLEEVIGENVEGV